MNTQEVKGTLAKLLATENLTVEHRKVSTACFDVDKRLLILPIWKTASNTVYDLLVGHEVGHALYTPNEDFSGASKAFVNVLEDARIEKMMKVTYPGLRKSFFEGYKELWDRDFFGVKNEDPSDLSLIDRINLYFKGKPDMVFSDDERTWVDRAANTKSFQEVIQLALELWEYVNQKKDETETETPIKPQSENGQQSADSEEEIDFEDQDDEGEGEDGEYEDTAELEIPTYQNGGEIDETQSITDEALSQALETLVDDDAKEWVYLTLPKINLEDYIVPYDVVQENLQNHYYGYDYGDDEESKEYYERNLSYAVEHYNSFKKDTQKTVNYLCKQFEMRKSADEYKRAATSKTGVLDTNKLHTYKYNDDIFKKITIIPEGKNHGLVMHLDWSGSMQSQLLDTMKQLYNLVWFCKKCGIPFRVYAFQSGFVGNRQQLPEDLKQSENELAMTKDFRLLEMFSSRQNAKSLEKSMHLMYVQAFSIGGYRIQHYSEYTLGGTPLAEAVYCTREIVAQLKKVERVSKVNVICLTDGESNPMGYIKRIPDEYQYSDKEFMHAYLCHQRSKLFFLRDTETGYTRRLNAIPYNTTNEIVSFYREITDYNWVGIRICSKAELTRLVRESVDIDRSEYESIDKQWKKDRYVSIKGRAGFTESFYMPNQGSGMGSQDLEVKNKKEVATRAELTRAFKKHMGSKMTNKTILNAFIEQIA